MITDLRYEGRARRALEDLLAEAPRLNRVAARELAEVVREANRIERRAGRDADGAPLRPVRTRIGRYAGASGPPLLPFGDASRAIAGFTVNEVRTPTGFTLVCGHRSVGPPILRYHAEGRAGTGVPIVRDGSLVAFRGLRGRTTGIRRDVLGIGPTGRASIREAFDRHRNRIAEFFRRAARRAASYLGGL